MTVSHSCTVGCCTQIYRSGDLSGFSKKARAVFWKNHLITAIYVLAKIKNNQIKIVSMFWTLKKDTLFDKASNEIGYFCLQQMKKNGQRSKTEMA